MKILSMLNDAIANCNSPDFKTLDTLNAIKAAYQEDQREACIAAAFARNDVEAAVRMQNGGDLEWPGCEAH